MDVHRLRILREFADRGTVAATAEALAMTPSAVSQQLKSLAREAGVLQRIARTGLAVRATDLDLPGSELPAMLADADVVVSHRDERAAPLGGPRIASRQLMREPIDLVVPLTHPLAGRARVDPAELGDLDWISVRDGFPVDDVLRSFATVTGVQPRIVQRINDFHTIQAIVAAGLGVALVARHAVTHPRVVGLEISGVRAARIVEVATRPGADRRPAVAAVMRALDEEAATVGGAS